MNKAQREPDKQVTVPLYTSLYDHEKAQRLAKDVVPRICALWDRTVAELKAIEAERDAKGIIHPGVFLSYRGSPACCDTSYDKLKTFAKQAEQDKTLTISHLRDSAFTVAAQTAGVYQIQYKCLAGQAFLGLDNNYVRRGRRAVEKACNAIEEFFYTCVAIEAHYFGESKPKKSLGKK